MTEEQKGWLERADEDVEAAQVLIANGKFDVAVSRTYYIMFYAVTAMMLEKGKRFKKHSAILSAFAIDWVQTGVVEPEYQRYLNNSFDMRNKADYDLGQHSTRESAEVQLARGEAFLGMARRVLTGT